MEPPTTVTTTPESGLTSTLRLLLIPFLLPFKFISLLFTKHPRRPLRRLLVLAIQQSIPDSAKLSMLNMHKSDSSKTGQVVQGFCKKNSLPYERIELPPHTSEHEGSPTFPPGILHVITTNLNESIQSSTEGNPNPDSTAPKGSILYYFHGGGYMAPLSAAHMKLVLQLSTTSKAKTIVILEYSLAPLSKYPTQLVQAIEGFRYLTTHLHHRPQDINIVGDSAGGHLALGLLAHLREPCPYVARVSLEPDTKIKRAVLISPWVSMRCDAPSYKKNHATDHIRAVEMRAIVQAWKPDSSEIWADMLHGRVVSATAASTSTSTTHSNARFWKSLVEGSEAVVDEIVITVGEDEIFLDDVSELAGCFGAGAYDREEQHGKLPMVRLVRCVGEAHTGALLDCVLGIGKEGSMLRTIVEIMRESA